MMASFSASFSLENKKEKPSFLLPPAHCLPPEEGEVFSTVEEGQTRLQDYAFTQGFALVQESFQKQRGIMVLDCSRHHTKESNTRILNEDERVRKHTKVTFNDCKYRFWLKKTREETWQLVITHSEHNHLMATDPFSFVQHHSSGPD